MSAITRLQPQDYAPGAAATHISEVTVEAIDKIGDATSTQLERAADGIEAAASELAGKIIGEAKEAADELRKAAQGHRQSTRDMSQEVSNFCLRMASARATVRSLEGQVKDRLAPVPSEVDDGDPSPGFLHTTDAQGRPNGKS